MNSFSCPDVIDLLLSLWFERNVVAFESSTRFCFSTSFDFKTAKLRDHALNLITSLCQNEAVMKTAKFYNVCVDAAGVEAQGEGSLKKLIEKMGGWFVTGNVTPLSTMSIIQRIGKVQSELLARAFVQVAVFVDPHDSSRHIMQVSFSSFLHGNRSSRSSPPPLPPEPCSPDHYPLNFWFAFQEVFKYNIETELKVENQS